MHAVCHSTDLAGIRSDDIKSHAEESMLSVTVRIWPVYDQMTSETRWKNDIVKVLPQQLCKGMVAFYLPHHGSDVILEDKHS